MHSGPQQNKIRLPGLGVSIIIFAVILFATAVSCYFAVDLAPLLLPSTWQMDLKQAKDLMEKDADASQKFILKAIKDAQAAHANAVGLAEIDCESGMLYLRQDNFAKGEKLIDHALAVAADAKAYDKLAIFGEDASWAEHNEYRRNPHFVPKLEYAQKAAAAGILAHGAGGDERCLWVLSELYMDLGDLPKAKECLDKVCKMQEQLHIEKHRYYHDGTLARFYALDHQWDNSLHFFLDRYPLASSAKDQASIRRDYQIELRAANPDKAKYDFSQLGPLLEKNNFAKLQPIADRVLANKEILPSGFWRVDYFYQNLISLDSSDLDERCQKNIKDLSYWVLYKPESAAARTALANANMRYGWKIWYNGASSSRDESWEQAVLRFNKAQEIVEEVQKLSNHGAYGYEILANIALMERSPRADFEKVVAECKQEFPDYLAIDVTKAYYLQPRWCGKNDESENYIKSVADARVGEEGDIVYSQLVRGLDDPDEFDNVFSENKGLDWSRTKRGLLALIQRYPHDTTIRGALISLALQADDQKAAKEAFTPAP